ncbi:hypothetical protein FRC02_001199 [Tulasnella sp. 418]|nr:hypothetical protein FRC02_001199 [Tulasnella sp. 418]
MSGLPPDILHEPSTNPAVENDQVPSNLVELNEGANQENRRFAEQSKTLLALSEKFSTVREQDIKENIDEHIQLKGADAFFHFEICIGNIISELLGFESDIHSFATASDITSSSNQLRSRLQQVVHLFRVNASALFPDRITKELPTDGMVSAVEVRIGEPGASTPMSGVQLNLISDLEELPEQLGRSAEDLNSFLETLKEIPAFTEAVSGLRTLGAPSNLSYWSSHLREFQGHFRYPAVQRHINDVIKEINEDMENIDITLKLLHEAIGTGPEAPKGSRSSSALDKSVSAVADLDMSGKVSFFQKIAGGGYSDVWKGTMMVDHQSMTVAIKELRIKTHQDPLPRERLKKRLFREIMVWRMLKHPNIVPLLGYSIDSDGLPSMISPWYPEGNVVLYLRLNPSVDRTLLAQDVARGLSYLHSISVVHGDIKGENVMVDENGSARLCDIGMSKFIDDAQHITGFTTTNANIGRTPRFLSPELLNDEPKTVKSDIWAFGCLLIQILTGQVPYPQLHSTAAISTAIIRGSSPYSNEILDSLPIPSNAFSEDIRKCWDMDPSVRPDVRSLLDIIQMSTAPTTVVESPKTFDSELAPHDPNSMEGVEEYSVEKGYTEDGHNVEKDALSEQMMAAEITEPTAAFLYGTLMHPSLLGRVLGNNGSHLQTAPGLLKGYSRHRVVNTSFPAVIPSSISRIAFSRSPNGEGIVRGVIVDGLTAADFSRIREYGESMYEQKIVHIQPLASFRPLVGSGLDEIPNWDSPLDIGIPSVSAYCEVWSDSTDRLEPDEWDYEAHAASKWDEFKGVM